MLRHLHVRNLAVVEDASVELGSGLITLTGETGAGKSLVVDSLSLLGGARASVDAIRSGATSLFVTGLFELDGERLKRCRALLEGAGLELDEATLVVRREVAREGPNRVFLNDQPVTLRLLGEIAPLLLRIHGQRDELGLLLPEQQRAWVDREGGDEAASLLSQVRAAFDKHHELAARLERATSRDRARQERLDLLRFQRSEIDAARVGEGEEDELRRERERLRHAEEIGEAVTQTLDLLSEADESASSQLGRAEGAIEELAAWFEEGAAWQREVEELRIRAEELAATVRHAVGEVEADPRRLEQVEDRLVLLERLLRKYGGSSTALLEQRRQIELELADLDADDEHRESLQSGTGAALAEYERVAKELSGRRAVWSESLRQRVERQLGDLALGRARFGVRMEPRAAADSPLRIGGQPVEMTAEGVDEVTFELAANPGEPARPLARVASGGELARIYLALQLAVRGTGAEAGTLVFDEVDTGLGGAEAAVVGRKLRQLGRERQVLAVTHLPQVAAQGDRHHRVRKLSAGGRTRVEVTELADAERVSEIARMLAAERVTDSSLSHARSLLEEAGAAAGPAPGKRPRRGSGGG